MQSESREVRLMAVVSVVPERGRLEAGEVLEGETPAGQPNVETRVLPWWKLVVVRALRTAIQTFLASMGVAMVGPVVPGLSDLFGLSAFYEKALLAVVVAIIAAVFSALQNIWELLGKIDQSHPELRA
jgi:hypothetical protein